MRSLEWELDWELDWEHDWEHGQFGHEAGCCSKGRQPKLPENLSLRDDI